MSTITTVVKNGYAAIAADTLSKRGYHKEGAGYVKGNQKILCIQGNFIAIVGPTSTKLIIKDYLSRLEGDLQLESVESIFQTWRLLHEALKDRYFLTPDPNAEDAYESSSMDVLIATAHGIFGVAANRSVQEYSRFYAYGRGDEYAMGAMYAAYERPDLSAEAIAELGVRAAAEFYDSTGLPVLSYTVELASA